MVLTLQAASSEFVAQVFVVNAFEEARA